MDLISAHTYQGDRSSLLRGQAASSKRTALVGCEALDFMGRLRLIRVDPSGSPEPPPAAGGEGEAVIAESLGLQTCA